MTTANRIPGLRRTVFLRTALGLPIMALMIILPTGRWNYWQGWMYLRDLPGYREYTQSVVFRLIPGMW